MRWVRSAVVTGIAVTVMLLASSLPSGAITLITIRGVVADAAGRPVAGAQVTDGRTYVSTDSAGHYAIEEEEISDQLIAVSKPGYDPISRLVNPAEALSTVDFTVMYRVTAATSPRAFNNDPAKVLALTAKAYAPTADSCLTWTDGATGTVVALTLTTAVPGGQSTWSGSFAVPAGSADGAYGSTTRLTQCPSGVALAQPTTWTYIIDGVAPTISGILPKGYTNTMYLSQPLSAQLADSRSGIDRSTIQFLLRDLTAGTSTTLGSTTFTTGIAQTTDVALTEGHVYSTRVSVSDYAGNATTVDQGTELAGGWLAISATLGQSSFGFQPNVGSIDTATLNSDGTRTATFDNVLLASGATTGTLSGSQHLGDGSGSYTVPLLPIASVCTSIAGIETCLAVRNSDTGTDANWSDKTVTTRFGVNVTTAQTIGLRESDTNIGSLTVRILPAWQNVTLRTETPQSRTGSFMTCTSPLATGATPNCTTDPVANSRLAPGVGWEVLQFNMCGNYCNNNGTTIADETGQSIIDESPQFVTLNEVCESQANFIMAKLAAAGRVYHMRHSLTKWIPDTLCSFGNAIIWKSGSPFATYSIPLPTIGTLEPRRLFCAAGLDSPIYGTELCVTHLTPDYNGVSYQQLRADQVQVVADNMRAELNRYRIPILGGDFNAEPNASELNPLYLPIYGSGSTGIQSEVSGSAPPTRTPPWEATNDYGKKIDYIFLSPHLIPVGSKATHADHSDHKPYYGYFSWLP